MSKLRYVAIICLAASLVSCSAEMVEYFGLNDDQVQHLDDPDWKPIKLISVPHQPTFKPTAVAAERLHLDKLPDATVVLLPVKSSMGGGMGEDMVTASLLQKLIARYKNIKFTSDEEAGNLFTSLDLWETYYDHLLDYYYQSNPAKVDKLAALYRKLGPDYLIGITADSGFSRPTPPRYIVFFVHIQIWDMRTGKLVWEGESEGEDISEDDTRSDGVTKDVVDVVCQNIVEWMQ